MNTKNTMGHKAAAQQVRAVIDSLDRAGSTPLNAGAARPDFRTVTITSDEAEILRKWVINEKAGQTIEIGLAFGFSALHICEGLLLNRSSAPSGRPASVGRAAHFSRRGYPRLPVLC
jgi:predicted O-methyltransferase YrrM